MSTVDLTINWEKGLIYQKLARLPEHMEQAALQALDEGADFIKMQAKILVRVDTGTLQKSIRKMRTRDRVVSVRAGGYFVNPKTGKVCDYAHWVEMNYPYMRPAFDSARKYIIDLIRQRVVEAIYSE